MQTKFRGFKYFDYLEVAFEETKEKEIEFLKNLPVNFTEEVVAYDEFSTRIGVSVEAVKSVLITNPPNNYVALPNCLIRKEKLAQISKQLENHLPSSGKMPLLEAIQLIESQGVTDTTNVLTMLNYKIIWHGISTQQAQIIKSKTNPE